MILIDSPVRPVKRIGFRPIRSDSLPHQNAKKMIGWKQSLTSCYFLVIVIDMKMPPDPVTDWYIVDKMRRDLLGCFTRERVSMQLTSQALNTICVEESDQRRQLTSNQSCIISNLCTVWCHFEIFQHLAVRFE